MVTHQQLESAAKLIAMLLLESMHSVTEDGLKREEDPGVSALCNLLVGTEFGIGLTSANRELGQAVSDALWNLSMEAAKEAGAEDSGYRTEMGQQAVMALVADSLRMLAEEEAR